MIVVVGMSHRSAPIEVRERMALSPEQVPRLLEDLVAKEPVGEAMIISTCNRVELIAAGIEGRHSDLAALAREVQRHVLKRAPGTEQHLYVYLDSQAVRHLFRVAASLDSLVLGEPQILGQVKHAFDTAREVGTVGPTLNRLVPRAIRSAKRVRTETRVGAGQVSVPSVAVDLARQIFGDLSWHTAVLIGSGEMGETVARLLKQAGARLVVTGRNQGRVSEIVADIGGEGRAFSDLQQTVADADVVVTTTSAPHAVVTYDMLLKNRRARRGRSLFFIDLAVPRDVDPRADELDGVFLYNVDDLSRVVADSLSSREQEAERAEQIVALEAQGYDRWAEGQQVTPTIVALRARMRSVLETEIDKSLGGKLKLLPASDRNALAKMVEAALNKLLHGPTTRLRKMAADDALRGELDQYVEALTQLFELPTEPAEPAPGEGDPASQPEDSEPRRDDLGSEEGRQGVR